MINKKYNYFILNNSKFTSLDTGQKIVYMSNNYIDTLKTCNYLNENKLKYGSNEDNYIIVTFNNNIYKKITKDFK